MALNNKNTGGWGRATASPQFRVPGSSPEARPQPPTIQLVGDIDHHDFREAVELLRNESRFITSAETRPELIVIAQSRPDTILVDQLRVLQRAAPLAGMTTLLSWCEGETRTGRPLPGAQRLYWYEFPAWWRRQLQLRSTNQCPDWARPAAQLTRQCVPGHPRSRSGLVVLRTARRDNADALADALNHAGHPTAWHRHDRTQTHTHGAFAGIWDGGQLNDAETADLEVFCTQMSRDGAPVVVLLDFPRRDRVDRAYAAGATAVLGKPWFNTDLLSTLDSASETTQVRRVA